MENNKLTKPSALGLMAAKLSVDPAKLLETLKATVFRGASNEELLALVVVANQYGLNPILKELYAFPAKGGGIVPVVSIDGWAQIVNRQDGYDGVEFEWRFEDDGKPVSCTCRMHVKGRTNPVVITEFLEECHRNTEPWNKMPRRMLRHKAFMQAARIAFGLSGIMDEDEGRDASVVVDTIPTGRATIDVVPLTAAPEPKAPPEPKAEEKAAPKSPTPQEQLGDLCTDNGFSFDDIQKWGVESGNIPGCDAMAGFEEIPTDIAKRLLRASKGLMQGLTAVKGAAV